MHFCPTLGIKYYGINRVVFIIKLLGFISFLMSDSFEEFKKIEWKWNQRWYEFGYHTLKNKVKEFQQEIDDIDGEISRLNVLLESKKREQQCLSDEITQMTSNPRESKNGY